MLGAPLRGPAGHGPRAAWDKLFPSGTCHQLDLRAWLLEPLAGLANCGGQLTGFLEAPASSLQELAGEERAVGVIHGERTPQPECRGPQDGPSRGGCDQRLLCGEKAAAALEGMGVPQVNSRLLESSSSTWLHPACPSVPGRECQIPEGPGRPLTLLCPGQDGGPRVGVVLSGRHCLACRGPGSSPTVSA